MIVGVSGRDVPRLKPQERLGRAIAASSAEVLLGGDELTTDHAPTSSGVVRPECPPALRLPEILGNQATAPARMPTLVCSNA